jgi:hypothetical protein
MTQSTAPRTVTVPTEKSVRVSPGWCYVLSPFYFPPHPDPSASLLKGSHRCPSSESSFCSSGPSSGAARSWLCKISRSGGVSPAPVLFSSPRSAMGSGQGRDPFCVTFDPDGLFSRNRIEIKASRAVDARDLRGFQALAKRKRRLKRRIVVILGSRRQKIGESEAIPLESFLDELPA